MSTNNSPRANPDSCLYVNTVSNPHIITDNNSFRWFILKRCIIFPKKIFSIKKNRWGRNHICRMHSSPYTYLSTNRTETSNLRIRNWCPCTNIRISSHFYFSKYTFIIDFASFINITSIKRRYSHFCQNFRYIFRFNHATFHPWYKISLIFFSQYLINHASAVLNGLRNLASDVLSNII